MFGKFFEVFSSVLIGTPITICISHIVSNYSRMPFQTSIEKIVMMSNSGVSEQGSLKEEINALFRIAKIN